MNKHCKRISSELNQINPNISSDQVSTRTSEIDIEAVLEIKPSTLKPKIKTPRFENVFGSISDSRKRRIEKVRINLNLGDIELKEAYEEMAKSSHTKRSIYPTPIRTKQSSILRDSYNYNFKKRETFNELFIEADRVVNKFKSYQRLPNPRINQMRKDYPCYYKEKLNKTEKLFAKRPRASNHKVPKKNLPIDNSFMADDYSIFRKRRKKMMKKFGFGKRTSDAYADACVRIRRQELKKSASVKNSLLSLLDC